MTSYVDVAEFHVAINLPLTPEQKQSIALAIQSAVTGELGKLDFQGTIVPFEEFSTLSRDLSVPSGNRPWLGLEAK